MGDFGGVKDREPTDQVLQRLRSFSVYTRNDEQEEARLGVSTRLIIYRDPWSFKKVLNKSDCNNLCRLMVPQNTAEKIIREAWDNNTMWEINKGDAKEVKVWDYDTNSEHLLTFKRLRSSGSYVFINNWSTDFRRRRQLKEGDEIGMLWDPGNLRFGFSVLVRAPRPMDRI